MAQNIFNSMELDAIGEIMNISLGSSATAVSNMLDHRVDITTPSVSVVSVDEFSIGDLEPAIGIEIRYVSGLEGSNIMLLKKSDVKVIVDILMGTETPDEEFELNELTISAVCEVMNQMMGAASTALSDFLGHPVNISTPQSFPLDNMEEFKKDHFVSNSSTLVVVRFLLSIEDILKSEFVNVMSVDLARELLAGFEMNFGTVPSEESAPAPEPKPAPQPEPQPAPQPQSAAQSAGGPVLSQEEIERMLGGMDGQSQPAQPQQEPVQQAPVQQAPVQQAPVQQAPVQQAPVQQVPVQQIPVQQIPVQQAAPTWPAPEPKLINATPMSFAPLDVEDRLGKEQADNLELIMSVPLEISVEIGRTRRKVEDILSFSKGSLVVLDKLAGDQVDLFVNGLCVARGDVVVIDDNFGVRITEVLKQSELLKLT
ncbi:flagellar motor switch protein FliN [uncultured Flavonifractor sp.]|uniref:Flagellar motor switch protein FliN n=1 Tax=Candidatus Flavonifractor intestinigallinarum TaxID=2838586 RepID=A0A9D2MNB3_9FIRM|nr:flagellar motor switch protein FliN [uncultured Flavonifractor sp.]HJB80905.1 flagellar motor switch protein FliN [Candidatus Flavonifractor intestinigallinarum]